MSLSDFADTPLDRRQFAHRVSPILYAPWQELEAANKTWRSKPDFDKLMENFIDLGYELWRDIDESYEKPVDYKPSRLREIIWNELTEVVKQLCDLGTPHYYLIGNRGRLTRTEFQQIYDRMDYTT